MQVYEKYNNRSVAFVSVTSDSEEAVGEYVKTFGIKWPQGCGADLESILALRAAGYGLTPGMYVAPTLYVVGSDGRITWSDERMRYEHKEPPEIRPALEKAIEEALASSS